MFINIQYKQYYLRINNITNKSLNCFILVLVNKTTKTEITSNKLHNKNMQKRDKTKLIKF